VVGGVGVVAVEGKGGRFVLIQVSVVEAVCKHQIVVLLVALLL